MLCLGVDENNIRLYSKSYNIIPDFLRNLRELFEMNGIDGTLAEAGVFKGETAAIINEAFPDRQLYLFDTFDGFSNFDTEVEKNRGYSCAIGGQFSNTSEEIVMSKMQFPDKVIIKKDTSLIVRLELMMSFALFG